MKPTTLPPGETDAPLPPPAPKKKRIQKLTYKSFQLYDCIPFDLELVKEPGSRWAASEFCVELYGCNELGETCVFRVTDMRPYFFVKVGRAWNQSMIRPFMETFRRMVPKLKHVPFRCTIVQSQSLGQFNNGELSTFFRLEFDTMRAFTQAQGVWYSGTFPARKLVPVSMFNTPLILHEGKIKPILRFFHLHAISPTGWVNICTERATYLGDPFTDCDYEFMGSVKAITPQPDKFDAAPLRTLSFDCEMSSSHGDFPVPIKDYMKPTLQIVDHYLGKLEAGTHKEARAMVTQFVKKMFHLRSPTDNHPIDVVYPKQFPFTQVPKTKKSAATTEVPAGPVKAGVDTRGAYTELVCTSAATSWVNSVLAALDSPLSAIASAVGVGATAEARARSQRAILLSKQFTQLKHQNASKCAEKEEEGDGDGDGDGEGGEGDGEADGDGGGKAERVTIDSSCCIQDRNFDACESTADVQNIPDNILAILTAAGDSPNLTLYHILADASITRDRKILYVNYLLTTILPPLEGDKITVLGSSFIRRGQKNPESHTSIVLNTCDPTPGMTTISVNTEKELLLAWATLVRESKPHILYGYNSAGFDWPFIYARAQENDCLKEVFTITKRIDEIGLKSSYLNPDEPGELVCTSVKLAAGEFRMYYPVLTGILQFDLHFYFRREFSNYASYRLDDVAGINICDDVVSSERGTWTPPPTHLHASSDAVPVLRLQCFNTTGLYPTNFICLELLGITTSATFLKSADGRNEKIRVLDIEYGPEGDATGVARWVIIDAEYEPLIRTQAKLDDHAPLCDMTWRVAKDDVSPLEIFTLSNGTSADRAVVSKYCRQDCDLPIMLANKTDMITGYFEDAGLCMVPVEVLVKNGVGAKLLSQFAYKCAKYGILIPDLGPEPVAYAFDGATVLTPNIKTYGNIPVSVNDFRSLYPGIASGYNFSHDSFVGVRNYDLNGLFLSAEGEYDTPTPTGTTLFKFESVPGREYIYTWYQRRIKVPSTTKAKSNKSIVVGYREVCWVLPVQGEPATRGIVPKVVDDLLQARADTRALIKIEKDEFKANIYDVRQLKYKVSCNSMYGQTGSDVSPLRNIHVAASITSVGRCMIMYTKAVVEQVYANRLVQTKNHGVVRTRSQYVYGDTDSVFFVFNPETLSGDPITGDVALEISIDLAKEVARLVSMFLPEPMKLLYEKTFMNFIIVAKKKYIGILYTEYGSKGEMKYMGLQMKKRDTCDCVKDVFGDVVAMVLRSATDPAPVLAYMNKILQTIVDGKMGIEKFGLTKALNSNYAKPQTIAHNVLANRIGEREPGTRPKPGDRIRYAFIVPIIKPGFGSGKKGKLLAGDKIETLTYIREHQLTIDYNYYITNHIMKPLIQLLGLILVPILRFYGDAQGERDFHNMMREIDTRFEDSMPLANKAREAYCSAQVRRMLFDPFILKLMNQTKGFRDISTIFLPVNALNRPKFQPKPKQTFAPGAITLGATIPRPENKKGDRSAQTMFKNIRK